MYIKKSEFLFLPIGGVGRIGMNVSLYHYNGKWIIIDLGVGFADEDMPGIELMIADVEFIKERRKDLLGIIVTHAHEDHCGAIPYLWEELQCPVFATRFTINFLKEKLKEFRLEKKVILKEVSVNGSINLDPFTIEFINITHSIPESNAILVSTDAGNVLHTGDWKFDNDPVIGPTFNIKRLTEIGNQGGLSAIICDSTNVFSKCTQESEGDIYSTIHDIVEKSKRLVAVSLFASNVARIKTIASVAQALNRKVVLLGKSLWRITKIAKNSGYLEDSMQLLDADEAINLPREKLLLICTGCQGEKLAATAKLATNLHKFFKMQQGDTMIFSSKIIPGNEIRIHKMFNAFIEMGVEVITEKSKLVHASGHPTKEELKTMYSLVKPKISIPVHGEYIHMYEHIKLAEECGIKNTVMVKPGDFVNLVSGGKVGSITVNYFGIDGKLLRCTEGNVIKARKRMRDSGLIVITVIVSKKNVILTKPKVFAPGIFDLSEDASIMHKIIKEVELAFSSKSLKVKEIKDKIEQLVSAILKRYILKKPIIEVQIEQV
ncbi:ribonuclease J [Wolbachia endosymbiont of Pentidionis agamae]|uniref:ribonuclease J n=1 Tax=Wolbachia endosymbiont of Pentidionis agamae TaxID=3110435 RepID=UPI002FCEE07C